MPSVCGALQTVCGAADLASVLANAGLDPRIAARFWQQRLDAQDSSPPAATITQIPSALAAGLRMHSSPEAAHRSFERTHVRRRPSSSC